MSNRIFSSSKPFWYTKPNFLSMDNWAIWENQTKRNYPIQYFFRETIPLHLCLWKRIWSNCKYKVLYFFKPNNALVRKAVPRDWKDLNCIIVDVNLAIIAQFKQHVEETKDAFDASEEHIKFKNWLDAAADWVIVKRAQLQQQISDAYPPHPLPQHMKTWTYHQLYQQVDDLEKLLDETDANIIKQMIDYRDYFTY